MTQIEKKKKKPKGFNKCSNSDCFLIVTRWLLLYRGSFHERVLLAQNIFVFIQVVIVPTCNINIFIAKFTVGCF